MKNDTKVDEIISDFELSKSRIDELEKIGVRLQQKMERLETSWKSLMSNMGQLDVMISTKTKKLPAHKNVLAGKKIYFTLLYKKKQ